MAEQTKQRRPFIPPACPADVAADEVVWFNNDGTEWTPAPRPPVRRLNPRRRRVVQQQRQRLAQFTVDSTHRRASGRRRGEQTAQTCANAWLRQFGLNCFSRVLPNSR
jgi:hypothetical protein